MLFTEELKQHKSNALKVLRFSVARFRCSVAASL